MQSRWETGPLPFDTARVVGNLWTGGMPLSRDEVTVLHDAGIRHVINLSDEYTLTAKRVLATDQRIDYHHNPARDDGRPKPFAWFATSAALALPALARGEGVYIHCLCGSNRGPSTAYLLLRLTGFTPKAAENAVRRARPTARLIYLQDAERAAERLLERRGRRTDMPELNTNRSRVLDYLQEHEGEWVVGPELANPAVGGSEGLKRLRELRADGWPIEKRRHPEKDRHVWQYRLLGPRDQLPTNGQVTMHSVGTQQQLIPPALPECPKGDGLLRDLKVSLDPNFVFGTCTAHGLQMVRKPG